MITFKEVYEKAIYLFDDPDIKQSYYTDEIRWQRLMYPHLKNGVHLFQNPTKIAFMLTNQVDPDGAVCTFEGTGESQYTLDSEFVPPDGCDLSFYVDRKIRNDATYDAETHTVTFAESIPVGANCYGEWYTSGNFAANFAAAKTSLVSEDVIVSRIKDILAHALVIAWAENERNFALEIRNVLTDTDFKLYSPANSVRAKVEWVTQLKHEFDTLQTKFSWDLLTVKYTGGNYYA